MNPEAIEAAAKALRDKYAAEVTELPVESFINDATAALEAAAPYLIRESRAAELEAAAEALYVTARAELQTADSYQWPMARRAGYTDGMINARHVMTARATAIRDGAR